MIGTRRQLLNFEREEVERISGAVTRIRVEADLVIKGVGVAAEGSFVICVDGPFKIPNGHSQAKGWDIDKGVGVGQTTGITGRNCVSTIAIVPRTIGIHAGRSLFGTQAQFQTIFTDTGKESVGVATTKNGIGCGVLSEQQGSKLVNFLWRAGSRRRSAGRPGRKVNGRTKGSGRRAHRTACWILASWFLHHSAFLSLSSSDRGDLLLEQPSTNNQGGKLHVGMRNVEKRNGFSIVAKSKL
mmetsp:Transcript_21328/g.44509  ORF Transcript_21328/g.44509 Transcript_21328/m.44509 type:complete len:241 (+) Transcript_21328:593-1315(+)